MRRPTPQAAVSKKSEPDSVLTRIKNQTFVGSKICIEWEALFESEGWKEKGKEVLELYANTSDVYLMCHISQDEQKTKILNLVRGIQGLRRYKVLFSTTEKGYEAFTRQINPALLITRDLRLAELLSRVLPYIALVRSAPLSKDNVACFNSVAELLS
ncbi:hypothetical protein STCU_05379 [Strigomonas culicis]|nr:hypothetical protein STCU_05379 [Strigomonas culicis]|eukprot:EPY27958.1 hypothetical protein STCU_05379 [Strigomonas culicis]